MSKFRDSFYRVMGLRIEHYTVDDVAGNIDDDLLIAKHVF